MRASEYTAFPGRFSIFTSHVKIIAQTDGNHPYFSAINKPWGKDDKTYRRYSNDHNAFIHRNTPRALCIKTLQRNHFHIKLFLQGNLILHFLPSDCQACGEHQNYSEANWWCRIFPQEGKGRIKQRKVVMSGQVKRDAAIHNGVLLSTVAYPGMRPKTKCASCNELLLIPGEPTLTNETISVAPGWKAYNIHRIPWYLNRSSRLMLKRVCRYCPVYYIR